MKHDRNPEQQFARQLCLALEAGTRELDPAITERLRAARERALSRQPVAACHPQIVGAGGTAMVSGDDGDNHPLRLLLAILALLLGVGFAYYWNSYSEADINEEIDSALLADELPPKAYLDPGFQTWLSHYAQDSLR